MARCYMVMTDSGAVFRRRLPLLVSPFLSSAGRPSDLKPLRRARLDWPAWITAASQRWPRNFWKTQTPTPRWPMPSIPMEMARPAAGLWTLSSGTSASARCLRTNF